MAQVPVPDDVGAAADVARWSRARSRSRFDGVDAADVILYFHGGVYVIGSAAARRCRWSAISLGEHDAKAVTLDYRLAPEHPYPAAVDDALRRVRGTPRTRRRSAQIALAGESAGGGLAVATLLALQRRRSHRCRPARILMSPYVDLTLSGETLRREAGPSIRSSRRRVYVSASPDYVGGADAANPRISPIFGDLDGPPAAADPGRVRTRSCSATRSASRPAPRATTCPSRSRSSPACRTCSRASPRSSTKETPRSTGRRRSSRPSSRPPEPRAPVTRAESYGTEVLVPQLSPGRHADLPEDVAEMPFDGARAEEEPAADLSIREPLLHELRDLQLLTRELRSKALDVPAPFADPVVADSSRRARSANALETHGLERVVRDLQLIAGVALSPSATQPFAIEQMGPSVARPGAASCRDARSTASIEDVGGVRSRPPPSASTSAAIPSAHSVGVAAARARIQALISANAARSPVRDAASASSGAASV